MSRLLLALLSVLAATSGSECEPEGAWQSARVLGESAHSYLESLVGKEALGAASKVMSDSIEMASTATASALNAAALLVTELLGASGFSLDLTARRVTPEGVVFVARWALFVAVGYWLISLAVRLLAGVLRSTLALIKLALAAAAFVAVLSDTGAGAGTTAARLAGLVLVCVLLGFGPAPAAARDCSPRLEERVRQLERRFAEAEKRTARRHERL